MTRWLAVALALAAIGLALYPAQATGYGIRVMLQLFMWIALAQSWNLISGLTGYVFSTLTVLTLERVHNGGFIAQGPNIGRLWFALTGIVNGIGTLLLYAAVGAGPVTLVTPLIATYPLFTVGLSALALANVRITARLVLGVVLTIAGVALILAG